MLAVGLTTMPRVARVTRGAAQPDRRARLRGRRRGARRVARPDPARRDPAEHPLAADGRGEPAADLRDRAHRRARLPRLLDRSERRRLGPDDPGEPARARVAAVGRRAADRRDRAAHDRHEPRRRRHRARRDRHRPRDGPPSERRRAPQSRSTGCASSCASTGDRHRRRGHVRDRARRGARARGRVRLRQDDGRARAARAHPARCARSRAAAIRIGDVDVLALGSAARRSIRGRVVSYVPQDPAAALNPALRIGTQLRETLEVHGFGSGSEEREARIAEVMREVALPDDRAFLRRYPHELSGGQQQRIGLAMAFACRPARDRARRADDRPRRDDAGARARAPCASSPRPTASPRSTSATTSPSSARSRPHRGHVCRARRRDRPDRRAVPRPPRTPTRAAWSQAIPHLSGRRELIGIPGRAPSPGARPERLHVRAALHVRARGAAATRSRRCRELAPVAAGHRCAAPRRGGAGAAWSARRPPRASTSRDTTTTDAVLTLDKVFAGYGATDGRARHQPAARPRTSASRWSGESGSGKTTLARSIAGLHRDRTGEILLRGTPLAHAARAPHARVRRQSIQYVFQNPYGSLNPRKTIGQIVRQPLGVFGERDRRATPTSASRRCSSASRSPRATLDRYPDQLSGGERQRVAIARALVVRAPRCSSATR